jgi:hypothetical protein
MVVAMPLHYNPRVARRLSTILVIGATLFGPQAVTAAAPGSMSVVVFVDFSASIQGAARASYRRALQSDVLPMLAPGDRIMIAPIHHRTLTAFRPLAQATLPVPPRFNAWVDNHFKFQRQLRAAEQEVADTREQLARDVYAIFTRPYASPYTDIFSSLVMAEKIFTGEVRRKVLVLMSDMIEDLPPYKFDAMSWRPGTTEKLLGELESRRKLPDLTGVCVYVSGASAANTRLAREIARFWDTYFRQARADFDPARYARVLLNWPPSKGCGPTQAFKP